MLDQKLIRENPTSVEENLSLRGKVYKISHIHELTVKKKDIDIEISSLQSESKKLSKLIGQEISKSKNNDSPELISLKKKGNEYRISFPFSLNHLILVNYYFGIFQLLDRLICLIFYSQIGDWIFLYPVSYTHLTLPTIRTV